MIFYYDLLHSIECDIKAYADDTSLVATGNDVNEIRMKLTDACLKVYGNKESFLALQPNYFGQENLYSKYLIMINDQLLNKLSYRINCSCL